MVSSVALLVLGYEHCSRLVTCSVAPSCFGHFLFSWVEIGLLHKKFDWMFSMVRQSMTSVHLTVSFVQHPLT